MSNQLKKILLGALCVLLVMIGYVYVATDNSVPPKMPEAQSGMTGFTVINGITFVNSEDFNIACDGVYRTATNIAAGDSFSFALSLDRDATVSELLSQIGPGNDAYVVFYFDQKTQNWIEVGSNLFGATVSRVALNQFSSHVVPANTAVLVMTNNPVQKCFKPGQRNYSELEDVSGWSLKYLPKATLVDNVRMAFEVPQGGVAREIDMSSTKFLEKGLYWLFYDYSGEAERLDTKGVAFSQLGNLDNKKVFVTESAGATEVVGRFNFAAVDQEINFMNLRLGANSESQFRNAVESVVLSLTFEGNTVETTLLVSEMQFENSAARIEFIEDTADLIEQGTRLDVTYNLKASDVNVSLENAIAFGSGEPRDDDFFVTEAKALRPLDVVSSRLSFESEKLDEGDRFVISTFDLPELTVIDGLDYANVKLNLGAGSEISNLNLEVSIDAFDNANQSVEVIAVVGGVETTIGTLDLENTSLELSSDLVASVLDSDSKSLFLKLNLDIQRLMPADLQPKLVANVRALEGNVEIDLPLLAFNTPNFDLAIADFTTYGETCKLDASSYLSFNKIDELVQEVIEYENQLFGNLTTSEIQNYEFDIKLGFDTLIGLDDLQVSSDLVRDGIVVSQLDFEDRVPESISMKLATMGFADEFEALLYTIKSSHEENFVDSGNNAFNFAELLDITTITVTTPRSEMGYSIAAPVGKQGYDHPVLACSQKFGYGPVVTTLRPETPETVGQNILEISAANLADFLQLDLAGLDAQKEVMVYLDLNDYVSHYLAADGFEVETGVNSKKLHKFAFDPAFSKGFGAGFAVVQDLIDEIPNLSTIFAQQLVENPRDLAATELGLVDLIRNRTEVNGLSAEFNLYVGNMNSNLVKTTINLDFLANLMSCVAQDRAGVPVFADRLGHVESTFANFDQAGCPKILNVNPAQVVVTGEATSERVTNLLPATSLIFEENVFVNSLHFEQSVDNSALANARLELVTRIGDESSSVIVPFNGDLNANSGETSLNDMTLFLNRFAQLGEVSFEVNLISQNNDELEIRDAKLVLDLNNAQIKEVDAADFVQEQLISNYHNLTPSGGVCSLESFEFEMYNNFIRSGNQLIFQLYGDVDKYNFELQAGTQAAKTTVRGVQLDADAATLSVAVSSLELTSDEKTYFDLVLRPLTGADMQEGEYLELRSVSLAGRTLNFGNNDNAGFDNTLFPRMICGNTSLAVDPVSEVKDSLYGETYVSHTVELDIREGSRLTQVVLRGNLVDEMRAASNHVFFDSSYSDGVDTDLLKMTLIPGSTDMVLVVTDQVFDMIKDESKFGIVFRLTNDLTYSVDKVSGELDLEFANSDSYNIVLDEYAVDNADSGLDTDTMSNFLDHDSDADGISDVIEIGPDLANPINTTASNDPDYLNIDSDADGILDIFEVGLDSNNPRDTDNDGIPDYRDTDSDNDGVDDVPGDLDSDGTPDAIDEDIDGDGIPNVVEIGDDSNNPLNSDVAGEPDFRSLDSDGDGIGDIIEAGDNPVAPRDTDGDTLPDYRDTDSDNDGVEDGNEDVNFDGVLDDNESSPLLADTDGDTISDFYDRRDQDTNGDGTVDARSDDSDGDGILDLAEARLNENGVPADSDNDSVYDFMENDSDNDGINDIDEDVNANSLVDAGETDPTNDDTDGDGVNDGDELLTFFTDPLDTDSDDDGVDDDADKCPNTSDFYSAEQKALNIEGCLDLDSDGFYARDFVKAGVQGMSYDNCDSIANPVQTDGDSDGLGDDCDVSILEYTVEAGTEVQIGLFTNTDVNVEIDWGDTTASDSFDQANGVVSHTFASAGTYTVSITNIDGAVERLNVAPCVNFYNQAFNGNGGATFTKLENIGLNTKFAINSCDALTVMVVDSNKVNMFYLSGSLSLPELDLFDASNSIANFDFYVAGSLQDVAVVDRLNLRNFVSVRARSFAGLDTSKVDLSENGSLHDNASRLDENGDLINPELAFRFVDHVNFGAKAYNSNFSLDNLSKLPTYYCSKAAFVDRIRDDASLTCLPPKDFYQLP